MEQKCYSLGFMHGFAGICSVSVEFSKHKIQINLDDFL